MDEPSAVAEAATRDTLALRETIDTRERYGFAVDPRGGTGDAARNRRLLDAVNRALGEIKRDGTYQHLYDGYEHLPLNGSVLAVDGS